MMKDRDQKQKALRLSVANRWFPQLEVDVNPGRSLSERVQLVTDLDVLSSVPDEFRGFRTVVFDCKTKARESPVNRALWVTGILARVHAEQGFCILKKEALEQDHVLMANRQNVILLAEDEFDLYASATSRNYSNDVGNTGKIDLWDEFYELPKRYPKLESAFQWIRSGFWMVDDSAESCRKSLAVLKLIQPELDPSKHEHISLFLDLAALFSRALAVVICEIFKTYLHPKNQGALSDALLVRLYGGREQYEYRNEMYRRVVARSSEHSTPDLSLPEWDRFLILARQLLDSPLELQRVPLILREVALSLIGNDSQRSFAKMLCADSPQGARFAVLICDYLAKAAKLPPECSKISDQLLLSLLPSR